jgi:hypothetical protein
MKALVALLLMATLVPAYTGVTASPLAAPEPCSAPWVTANVTARAGSSASERATKVTCNLTLSGADRITKQLVLEGPGASNLTVDCKGATIDGGTGTINAGRDMILIRSSTAGRPENVTIKNCHVIGSVHIDSTMWQMYADDAHPDRFADAKRRSRENDGYVEWVRNTAPTKISLENVVIEGVSRIPLYITQGVSYFSLINSEVTGFSNSVGVYLDAESTHNTIKNNRIHVVTGPRSWPRKPREQMAIDGSSYNLILDNHFAELDDGGIYLYRNCGEKGVIRHSSPVSNTIVNNVFYYDRYFEGNDPGLRLDPAIWLGSRDGKGRYSEYCGDDRGEAFGSSASNLDYARYNVVAQNQIFKRSVCYAIRTGDGAVCDIDGVKCDSNQFFRLICDVTNDAIEKSETNAPNYIELNETVSAEIDRLAGCYYQTRSSPRVMAVEHFIHDGEGYGTGSSRRLCRDGEIVPAPPST